MAQFWVHRNANPATRKTIPFLLDIQSDLLADLATRVVVPLFPKATMQGVTLQTLTPSIDLEGRSYLMMTPQLAGVPNKTLGTPVADLSARRSELIAAIDLLVSGI